MEPEEQSYDNISRSRSRRICLKEDQMMGMKEIAEEVKGA